MRMCKTSHLSLSNLVEVGWWWEVIADTVKNNERTWESQGYTKREISLSESWPHGSLGVVTALEAGREAEICLSAAEATLGFLALPLVFSSRTTAWLKLPIMSCKRESPPPSKEPQFHLRNSIYNKDLENWLEACKIRMQSLWAESNILEALCLRRSPAGAQRFFLQCIDLSEFTATFSAANRRMPFFHQHSAYGKKRARVFLWPCHHAVWWQVAAESVNKRPAIPRGDDVIGTLVGTRGRGGEGPSHAIWLEGKK